jgi:hypothetical protein
MHSSINEKDKEEELKRDREKLIKAYAADNCYTEVHECDAGTLAKSNNKS